MLDLKEINKSTYPRLNCLGTQKSHKMNYYVIYCSRLRKIDYLESINVRFERSTSYHFILFLLLLRISNEHKSLSICHYMFIYRVELIVMMEDLHQSFHSNSFNQWINGLKSLSILISIIECE